MRIRVRIQGELGADHPRIHTATQFHPKPLCTISLNPRPPAVLAPTVFSNYSNPSNPLLKDKLTLQTANKASLQHTQSIYVNPNNKMYMKIEGKYIFLFLFYFKTSSFCFHQTRAIWSESLNTQPSTTYIT
jgi:hypothetical protein